MAARRNRTKLISISGIVVDDDVFKKPKPPKAKCAKIEGFVMSNSVSLADPHYSPTLEEIENGIAIGKKGWVRCLVCNIEIFAPNAKYHASICHWLRKRVCYPVEDIATSAKNSSLPWRHLNHSGIQYNFPAPQAEWIIYPHRSVRIVAEYQNDSGTVKKSPCTIQNIRRAWRILGRYPI